MNYELNNLIKETISKCKFDNFNINFSLIYPFTTENIGGYIKEFDLENKSLLTVGSSSDQLINSALFNCKKQTIIDICPYTKYYFYLKKAALLMLEYHEFFAYLCYRNYPIAYVDNKRALGQEYFDKIKGLLNELNNDAYLFWNELYLKFMPIDIRTNLFSFDEENIKVLRKTNLYLKDRYTFNETKDKIKDINPTFICDDIFKINIDDKFDNIWFSNISSYYSVEEMKKLVEKFESNLNIDGKILFGYLYDTIKNSCFDPKWINVYNLDKTNEILGDYISDFVSFIGVKGILHEDDDRKDSVLIYKKTRERD